MRALALAIALYVLINTPHQEVSDLSVCLTYAGQAECERMVETLRISDDLQEVERLLEEADHLYDKARTLLDSVQERQQKRDKSYVPGRNI